MKRFALPRALAATLAVALTLSLGFAAGSSFAAPPYGGHYGGHRGMDASGSPPHHAAPMFHQRALIRLHDELKLDTQQEALWKETVDFAREHRGAMRERFGKERAEIRALLDQPGVDLRAVARRVDELRVDGQKQREAVRDRWFAVYDSLDAEQKEKARAFFRDGMERMERFAAKAGERPGRGHPWRGPRQAPAQ
ncbi:MAG: periplasmic heavy metal sensor [Candidatus Accumulibacter sp.]|nr:periplasmic heavy metal sensor [Accumulibacter sp.]